MVVSWSEFSHKQIVIKQSHPTDLAPSACGYFLSISHTILWHNQKAPARMLAPCHLDSSAIRTMNQINLFIMRYFIIAVKN
jgi:hypothetical protein